MLRLPVILITLSVSEDTVGVAMLKLKVDITVCNNNIHTNCHFLNFNKLNQYIFISSYYKNDINTLEKNDE
jgi:hypothetical protein